MAQLTAVTADAPTAARLKSVLDGLAAAAMLNAEADPRAAELGRLSRVEIDGTKVQLSLTLPGETVKQWITQPRPEGRGQRPQR